MDRGIENLVRLCGLTIDNAVAMATTNAARAAQMADERTDSVHFGWDGAKLDVVETWLNGRCVYSLEQRD